LPVTTLHLVSSVQQDFVFSSLEVHKVVIGIGGGPAGQVLSESGQAPPLLSAMEDTALLLAMMGILPV
jgi:hypothetical protein